MAARADHCRTWQLALDELVDSGESLRPRIPYGTQGTAPTIDAIATALSLIPLPLDPLTVADDPKYLNLLNGQHTLRAGFADAIRNVC